MAWTKAQQRAIETRDTTLLVSAAAGSGKTAVLVERILRQILEEGADIDRFLVVTFTKAAASEMKDKLVRAIKERLRGEEDASRRLHLKAQLDKMYLAHISTFHSFAIDVVRRFFHFLDIDPSVTVCDEGEADILMGDAMEETFRVFFEEEREGFLGFLDQYSAAGGETALKEALLTDYKKLRSFPHYFTWLTESTERLQQDMDTVLQGEAAEFLEKRWRDALKEAADRYKEAQDLLEAAGLSALAEKNRISLEEVCALLERHPAPAKRAEKRALLEGMTAVQMRASKEEKEAYEPIKKEVAALRGRAKKVLDDLTERYLKRSEQKEETMLRHTAEAAYVYRSLLEDFEERYREAKRDRGVMDFGDIEHYAIDVLSHEEARAHYRDKFAYIFIDEYQDSNYLQEAIIERICREDNVFMVGDVKQSIYRFRMAEPDIFLDKYRRFREEPSGAEAIDLNHNFRSKRPILVGVNHLFSSLMDGYDAAAALRQGAPSEKDIDYPVEVCVVDRGKEGAEALDEALLDMRRQEWEALAVAKLIEEAHGTPFYDPKKDEVRPLTLRDMVILMRSVKTAGPIFKDVLAAKGYGVYVEEAGGYFDTVEISTFLDLLRIIDNPQQDLALLSALRSFFFSFSIEELIALRLACKEESYYRAFRRYGEEGRDAQLSAKVRRATEQLDRWRRLATYTPLEDMIAMLLFDTGYYACMGAIPGGGQRQANLRALVDKAAALRESGRATIYGFLRYIEALQERRSVSVGQVSLLSETDDVVRIMTIHKSKGLEFPAVFVCGLGAGKPRGRRGGLAYLDREMGLALPYVNAEKRYRMDTLLAQIMKDKAEAQEREEDIRVLYVALTRARDRLYLVANVDGETPESSYYYGMLAPLLKEPWPEFRMRTYTLSDLAGEVHEAGGDSEAPSKGGRRDAAKSALDHLLGAYVQRRDAAMARRVGDILSFRYPYSEELGAKSKYAVTELNHREETPPVTVLPRFFSEEDVHENAMEEGGENTLSGAALGTVLHTVMEHLPLKDLYRLSEAGGGTGTALSGAIADYLDDLVRMEILLPAERRQVDPSLLSSFVEGPLAARIVAAGGLTREVPFSYTFVIDGRDTLVQGVMDGYFEEEDGLVLLDYKSNVDTRDIRDLYRKQIALYREALAALAGRPVKEAYLYLLRTGELLPM